MASRVLIAVSILSLTANSCSGEEPSRTEVLCNRLLAAHAAEDPDRVEQVVESMLDLGTEAEPQGVEGEVYAHALLMQMAIRDGSQLGFNAELDALLAECRKVANENP
jgi:hypothetical protein